MSSENIQTRTRILKAALTLLESGHGSGVRMSDIAKAAKISRQAVYLHFPSRAEMLVAASRHLDEVHDIDGALVKSRTANSGLERLDAWVKAWGNHIPNIYGVAKALIAMMDGDDEARHAWDDRMGAVRHGCAAAVAALRSDNVLLEDLDEARATDLLWTLLSVRNWEQLRKTCGWSQADYITTMQQTAKRVLVRSG